MIKLRYFLYSLLLLPLLYISPINAAKIEVGDYTLDKESIVEDDLYISGDNIKINGVVDGDLIVFGNNVLVDGTVTGDIYLFGSTVSVSGNVYGNSILGGSTIKTNGTYGGNLMFLAMMSDINGSISKDILGFSGTTTIAGTVTDDVRVASGQINSTATVGGDFLVETENYTIDENDVTGQLVLGMHELWPESQEKKLDLSTNDFLGFNLGLSVVTFLGMYVVGVLIIMGAPVKTLKIEKKIIESWSEFLKSYAIGIVILFTIPLPLFFLVLTLVGVPLAFLITGILIFLSIFGVVWAESSIGQKILQLTKQKDNGRLISLLIGRLISSIIKLIPFINGIYTVSLIALTVGSVVRTKYESFMISRNSTKKIGKKK